MTRDEFMKHARDEIERVFLGQRNRMMNLVEQAWAEGKKNAEVSGIEDIVKEANEKIYDKPEAEEWLPHTIQVEAPDIPSACRNCSNHPSNGGFGNCNCIMGITPLNC